MGRASRKKREQRDELPENLQFGPEFLQQSTTEWVDLVVQAGVASATAEGRDG